MSCGRGAQRTGSSEPAAKCSSMRNATGTAAVEARSTQSVLCNCSQRAPSTQLAGTAASGAAAHPQAHACVHNVLLQEFTRHQVFHAVAWICTRARGRGCSGGCLGGAASLPKACVALRGSPGKQVLQRCRLHPAPCTASLLPQLWQAGDSKAQGSWPHPGHRGCCAAPACALSAGPAR